MHPSTALALPPDFDHVVVWLRAVRGRRLSVVFDSPGLHPMASFHARLGEVSLFDVGGVVEAFCFFFEDPDCGLSFTAGSIGSAGSLAYVEGIDAVGLVFWIDSVRVVIRDIDDCPQAATPAPIGIRTTQ